MHDSGIGGFDEDDDLRFVGEVGTMGRMLGGSCITETTCVMRCFSRVGAEAAGTTPER